MANILVIDDNVEIRELYRRRLEKLGHNVSGASMEDTNRLVPEQSSTDLIIIDTMVPGKTGAEVVGAVQRSFPNAKIIAVSSEIDPLRFPDISGSLASSGVALMFPKPVDWSLLVQSIDVVMSEDELISG